MNALSRAAAAGSRRAWLWLNRRSFAEPASSLPRLFVDVSAIVRHDAQTGIQRVVRAIWSELDKRSGSTFLAEPVFATSRRGYCFAPRNFLEKPITSFPRKPVGMGPGDIFLGLDLSAHLLPKYRHQLRRWRSNGAKVCIVVYDLLPLLRPEWFTVPAQRNFARWFRTLCSETDQALCISDHVADELRRMLGSARLPKVGRLNMGADLAASRPSKGLDEEVVQTLDGVRTYPTILMVGTIEPRKGYDVALKAFEYLWQRGDNSPRLVIIGRKGWKTSALQERIRSHPEQGKRLHWLENVSDEALCEFYDLAAGVLITSFGEGFGLPLMEAALHGQPILARNLQVFREQQLESVSYFTDDSPQVLGDAVLGLLNTTSTPKRSLIARLPTWSGNTDLLLKELQIASGSQGHVERPSEGPVRRGPRPGSIALAFPSLPK